jgi:pantothenate kinase type III
MGTVITVYIISTNMEQAQRVAWCFGEIPCRIYMMQPDDFYTEEQGRYPNMGVDRLAGLKATEQITGYPCLVIDGGTCLTYASCDDKGHIKGGGISLGLLARFAAISGQTEQSPGMEDVSSAELMLERAHAMVEAGHPLEFFCRNTQDAVISTALRE